MSQQSLLLLLFAGAILAGSEVAFLTTVPVGDLFVPAIWPPVGPGCAASQERVLEETVAEAVSGGPERSAG